MNSAKPAAESCEQLAQELAKYLRWLESSGRALYMPRPPVAPALRTTSEGGIVGPSADPDPGEAARKRPFCMEASERREVQSPPAAKNALPPAPAAAAPSSKAAVAAQAKDWSAAQKLDYLRNRVIGDCQRCPLARSRKQLVFGEGNPEARVMLIGEAPGAQEDQQGRPFVGLAGQRLDRWIERSQWRRSELFIANVLKCRPPQNRDPSPQELQACRGFLQAQIRAIAPDVIVALGRFAGALVLGRPGLKLYEMRGRPQEYRDPKLGERGIPVVVTYHPSYVLRRERELQPGEKASQEESKVLADFARARTISDASAPGQG